MNAGWGVGWSGGAVFGETFFFPVNHWTLILPYELLAQSTLR